MEQENHLPQHIAVILDGNGRWAKAQGRPRSYGHLVGCENLERICNLIGDMGIPYLTVYAFSTENWKRSVDEVTFLMALFRKYLKRLYRSAHERNMRIRFLGDKAGMDPVMQKLMTDLEKATKANDSMMFQIALNYGGRDEIERAATRIAEDARKGILPEGRITEEIFASYLDTAGCPDPDLLIRTSGEQRLSNFLPWQLAYTEFYFTEVPWPAFGKEDLLDAIDTYNGRDRRYGGVK